MSENMKLWDSVCVTDPKVTKKVNVGRSFIAICAQSQIRRATELWGPMGDKWGVRDESYNIHGEPEKSEYCVYLGTLYYPDGEILIHSDIEIQFSSGKRKGLYNEDFSKKAATDALTKGLSKLGFNADIFEGKFDDNKYMAEAKAAAEKSRKTTKKTDPPPSQKTIAPEITARQKIINEIGVILKSDKFNDEDRTGVRVEISLIKTNIGLEAIRAVWQGKLNRLEEGFKDDDPEKSAENDLFADDEKTVGKEAGKAKGLDDEVMY